MADVKRREGGIYSLFCYECNRWIPNTANTEMRKEEIYAYSHECNSSSPLYNQGVPYEEGLLKEAQ